MNRKDNNSFLITGRIFKAITTSLLCLIAMTPTVCFSGQSEVSQFGITWIFDRDYVFGQFANGDYWVAGPVTIVGIDPASIEVDGRWINGSMINPSPRLIRRQSYDSAMYGQSGQPGDYDASLNVARPNGQNLSAVNPLHIDPNSSLVSTISTASVVLFRRDGCKRESCDDSLALK